MKKPKYKIIKEWLRLEALKSKSQQKMPTVREIKERFNASFVTVDKVLHELEHEGIICRRQGSKIIACANDGIQKSISERKPCTRSIIFSHPAYYSPMMSEMIHSFEMHAKQNALSLFHHTAVAPDSYDELPELAGSCESLIGILINTGADKLDDKTISRLSTLNIPVIIIDNLFDYKPLPNMYSLSVDMYARGRTIAEIFFNLGHNKIAFIRNEPLDDNFSRYLKGAKDLFKEKNLPKGNVFSLSGTVKSWESSARAAKEITQRKLNFISDKKITALAYYSSSGAMAGIQALEENGYKVPQDISVFGGTDYWYTEFTNPALSVVDNNYEQIFADAFNIALGNLSSDTTRVYKGEAIMRKSVGAVKNDSINY
jgi:DNA-binding LacI/PurR family transcriptional regulator